MKSGQLGLNLYKVLCLQAVTGPLFLLKQTLGVEEDLVSFHSVAFEIPVNHW